MKYVGQTVNPEKRWTDHKRNADKCAALQETSDGKMKAKYGTKFYKGMSRLGANNFKFEIIEKVKTKIEANKLEIFYIKKYNSYKKGYNSTPGGDNVKPLVGELNGMYGKTHTPEVKKKLSELAKKATGKSYEERYGKETAQRMKEERKKLFAEYRKNNPPIGIKNKNAKQILLVSPQGTEHIIHGGLRPFCKDNNIEITQIISMLKGRRPDYKGWTGEYL